MWTTSASTGLFFIDFVLKPIMRVSLKWPVVGMTMLLAWYAFVAYHVIKSTYLSE